jgi:hypothetical protein
MNPLMDCIQTSELLALHIDDEAVSVVRHEDVFGSHRNEQVDHQCAYMLFYCRTAGS